MVKSSTYFPLVGIWTLLDVELSIEFPRAQRNTDILFYWIKGLEH